MSDKVTIQLLHVSQSSNFYYISNSSVGLENRNLEKIKKIHDHNIAIKLLFLTLFYECLKHVVNCDIITRILGPVTCKEPNS